MQSKHTLDVLWTRLCALEKLLDERRASDSRALGLQATEYERRLDELNHTHREARARDSSYVSREIFDAVIRDMNNSMKASIDHLRGLVYIGVGLIMAAQIGLTIWSIVK